MNPLGEHLPEVEIKSLETTQKENSIGKIVSTPERLQSKMHLTIDKYVSKIASNSVFDCHLSPDWRQMAIENSLSNDFLSMFVYSINIFDCRLSGVGKIVRIP